MVNAMRHMGLLSTSETRKIQLETSTGGWRSFGRAALATHLNETGSQDERGMLKTALAGSGISVEEVLETLDE